MNNTDRKWKSISTTILLALGGLGATALAPHTASAHVNTKPVTKRVLKHKRARFNTHAMRRHHKRAPRVKRIRNMRNHVYTAHGIKKMHTMSTSNQNNQSIQQNQNVQHIQRKHINRQSKRNTNSANNEQNQINNFIRSSHHSKFYAKHYKNIWRSLNQLHLSKANHTREAVEIFEEDEHISPLNLQSRSWVSSHESGHHWNILSYGGRCIGYYQLDPGYLGKSKQKYNVISSSYQNLGKRHINLDAAHQTKTADHYAHYRYGSWNGAKHFWQVHHWY